MNNAKQVVLTAGAVTFRLQEPHDFEWLDRLGHVFCVFDQQDSGNIGFGIEMNGRKRFLKYAGARPLDYSGDPADAVERLRKALPAYEALEHRHLIRLVDHFEAAGGDAALFEWFDGECLHSHWSYPPPAKYEHPDSPFYRYKRLPLDRRLASVDALLAFHEHAEAKGYVAVDFYDGSVLYDFQNHITKICDIDFYRQGPSVNEMGGGFWGAKRSKAPEEFALGAPIDQVTNVFTIGAVIFGLLGGETDRSYAKWEAGEALHGAALRAVQPERGRRYAGMAEFKRAWDAARQAETMGLR